MTRVYRNSTEIMQLHGKPFYMQDMVDACLTTLHHNTSLLFKII
jgi:hypothetical protein